jgi:hypothetical protein
MYDTTEISLPKNIEKMFDFFLLLYPQQYREQFSKEMRMLLGELYQEELNKKGYVGVGFWFLQYTDITKSVIEQHKELAIKKGMKRYLQQTFNINAYNIIGTILLLPFLLLFLTDIISRVLQEDLVHYSRPVYNFVSHTPLYWTPVLFTWVIFFPLLAVIINILSLIFMKTKARDRVLSAAFILRNMFTFGVIAIGLGAIIIIKLHDFAPCMMHGLLKIGLGQFTKIVGVCKNA